jgi:hypothetical protein
MRVAEQYAASMAGIIYQWLADPDIPVGLMFAELEANLRDRLELPADKAARLAEARSRKPTAARTKRANGNGRHAGAGR